MSRHQLRDDGRDSRQHVNVLMTVDVTDRDASFAHAANLRIELEPDFGQRDSAAQPLAEELRQVRGKRAVAHPRGSRPRQRQSTAGAL